MKWQASQMNDFQKMHSYAEAGQWDQAIALGKKLKNQGGLDELTQYEIPPSHLQSFISAVPADQKGEIVAQLSGNLHPDLNTHDLHNLWNHGKKDYITNDNILTHPNFQHLNPDSPKAGEFWNAYERRVEPSHFAAIKAMMTGEQESELSHRGEGHSSAHEEQIPALINHMHASQKAILDDPDIKKHYVKGEPHIQVYRGVGGSYAKALKNGLGVEDVYHQESDGAVSQHSVIDKHKTGKIPSAHMSSWSLDPNMAARFAGGRGEHDSANDPHHVVIKTLVPLSRVLHSGMHSLYPGHGPVHADEREVALSNPEGHIKVKSKDLLVGSAMGILNDPSIDSFQPLKLKSEAGSSTDQEIDINALVAKKPRHAITHFPNMLTEQHISKIAAKDPHLAAETLSNHEHFNDKHFDHIMKNAPLAITSMDNHAVNSFAKPEHVNKIVSSDPVFAGLYLPTAPESVQKHITQAHVDHIVKNSNNAQATERMKSYWDSKSNPLQKSAKPSKYKKLVDAFVQSKSLFAPSNVLPGGKGDDSKPTDLPPKDFAAGVKTELEHTSSPKLAAEIATDHIIEHKHYYRDLPGFEAKLKAKD
jgi:hypothetical protein